MLCRESQMKILDKKNISEFKILLHEIKSRLDTTEDKI
jgi:hypothetical protein